MYVALLASASEEAETKVEAELERGASLSALQLAPAVPDPIAASAKGSEQKTIAHVEVSSPSKDGSRCGRKGEGRKEDAKGRLTELNSEGEELGEKTTDG